MERQKKQLTDAERIALFYHVFNQCNDWQTLFKVAKGEHYYNALTDKSKQSRASEWKNSPKVKDEIQKLQYLKQREEERQREEIAKELRTKTQNGETEPTKQGANLNNTDFLNRDEFLKFLNDRANQVTDDKLRNDILKMLSDNMRYKENENEGANEIQRFYTPMLCESCEIYNKCKGCKRPECNNI